MLSSFLIPIYHVELILSVTDDAIAARRAHEAKFGLCLMREAQGIASASECGKFYAVFLNEKVLHPGLIAHEIFHVTHRIMHNIGAKFDINNHEQWAYLNEYITNWVYGELKKNKLV